MPLSSFMTPAQALDYRCWDPSNLQPPWWMCARPFRVNVPTPVNTVTQVSRSRSASKQAEDKPEKKGGFLSALGFNQETVYADDD